MSEAPLEGDSYEIVTSTPRRSLSYSDVVTALLPPAPLRCVRWITRDGAAHASRATSRESGLVSFGARSRGSSRPARTHAGWWGCGLLCPSPPPLWRAIRAWFADGRPHAGGRRRRASPSRAPHCACARAHAATHAGTGAGGGGSRVVSGVAGCARGGGRRARGTHASRQSWVRRYSEARHVAQAREHPTILPCTSAHSLWLCSLWLGL